MHIQFLCYNGMKNMELLSKVKDKLKKITAFFKGALHTLLSASSSLTGAFRGVSLIDRLRQSSFFARIHELSDPNHLPPEKRKLLFIVLGGIAVVFLILIIVLVAVSPGKPKGDTSPKLTAALSIPVEDLFMPEEPDFLPAFILERQPRSFWSLDDIRQYWKIPDDSARWKEEIKTTVDNLMEGVP